MRLNIERQNKLEPERMQVAKQEIEKLGYEVIEVSETELQFIHTMYHRIKFFPYSGWHTGSTIKDGKGLQALLKQIK